MDRQDKRRFVQQYVERQKAYIPTYTKEDLWSERQRTPSKPLRSDEFGFDTPVLRPRVPVNRAPQSQQQAGPSKPGAHETESGQPPEAPSETQDPPPSNDKPRPKRKKASTPIDTDNERAARLANRRERQRKKRAIVNPPQKHDEDCVPTAPPKKGRKNDQKAKKPAALALLYGFSATNVTKDRLTLKPVPSLGVFSKGKASAKKKVTATKKSSSKNEIFSESAFLNKPSERAADHSKVDDDSDDSSISSVSNDPTPKAICITNPTKKDRGKCTETTLKTPRTSARTTAESEVWDIELQSKLPSSARDVSSELGANDSAPIILDLRKAEWSASLNVAGEHEERCNRTRTRNLSVTRRSPLARSDLHDELGIPHAVDAPSIYPSHSASQVGRRPADTPSDSRQVTSRYFAKPEPVLAPQFAAESPQRSRSNDSLDVLDFRIPDQDVQGAGMDVQTILRVTSPIRSEASVAQPMVAFRTQSDVVPLEFPSDCSPYDDYYARADVPLEPLGGRDHGYFESSVVASQGAEYLHAQQGTGWDLYRSQWCSLAGLASDDAEYDFMEGLEGYDPLAPEYKNGLEEPVSAVELVDHGQLCEAWSCMGETREDFATYEDEGDDGSICWDGESGEGVAEFLEGRALLLGVPEWPHRVGLSGLAQAEMDVASRLRGHWRPLRLS